jgi:hypothetical protein
MMGINKMFLTILVILASSITYGVTTALATPATFSPAPDVGNTVVGDNDTFRQFLTCMLDADGDEDISEEEITSVLEAGSDEPVIVEEGEIKDCFEPLYVTGTGTTSTPSPSASVDTTDAAGNSGEIDDDEE